ncbi:hypothetical protein Cgig2_000530 [Carnegiea gigantea]|uniref:Uncharacterized protein n=1 Tax=Carnegiea gigantea TaxID=171969 RepID=A0A9Q1JES9_9CARY|nr:hypothetical protein Cgig2_000530 [Carnegiea gigantea]
MQEDLALKSEGGVNENRTYQKAFITRISTHSFSSLVAQLNEPQAKAIRSMRFAPFLKVDVKQISGKFSNWLVESFDPYVVHFRLPDGQKFPVTTFDVHVTLGVPLGGTEIIKITMSSMDGEYDENRYCNKSILKYLKDVNEIVSLDWCQFVLDKLITSVRHYKESIAAKGKVNDDLCAPSFSPTILLDKLDGKAEISGDTFVSDASIIIKKEEHHEDVVLDQPKNIIKKDHSMPSYSLGLGLSQLDNQSPVPQNTPMPDPRTAVVNQDYGIADDDDGAPFRIPFRSTSQVNRELIVKKPAEKKPKEDDEPASERGEAIEHNNRSPKASDEQVATDSKKPKLTKEGAARTPKKLEEVGPSYTLKKQQPRYYSPHVIRHTKLDTALSQDELTISEYVSAKSKIEPLFDSCGDKEATRASMVTLRPGE